MCTDAGDNVDFVEEEDAGRLSFGALKEIADVLFRLSGNAGDDFWTGNAEHRKSNFARDAFGEQSLPATWKRF